MPKFFVFGDVHGYYDIFKEALFYAGYDPQNEDHWLISLGDNFDRGPGNKKMLEFLKNMKRLIMIKGNHETLLEDMIARGYYGAHDLSNGTLDTALQISGECADFTDLALEIRPILRKMRNYFETENYILFMAGLLLIAWMIVLSIGNVIESFYMIVIGVISTIKNGSKPVGKMGFALPAKVLLKKIKLLCAAIGILLGLVPIITANRSLKKEPILSLTMIKV